ncbi:MAG TPA: MarR family transcriptional regulator [Candidatus Binataceae bacterium]
MKREQNGRSPARGELFDGLARPVEGDFVDHLVEEWKSQAPQLDWTPSAIIARMRRATLIFDRARERMGALYGIGAGEIMVLDALRRAGPPNRLNPRRLLEELLTPSGTMTSWIDRLAKRGFVKRMRDPQDRRGVLVHLAATGRRLVDDSYRSIQAQWRGRPEHAALAGMARQDLDALADLLRKLELAVESASSRPTPKPAGNRKSSSSNAGVYMNSGRDSAAGRQGARS